MKTIIFDFDGTLANTLNMLVGVYNKVAPKYGYKLIKQEEYDYLRGKTALQIKKYLGIPWWKIPFMLRQGRKLSFERIGEEKFVPGVKEVVKQLDALGFRLGIFTSNTGESINKFLKNNDCEGVFEFIEVKASLFNKNKRLRKLLKKYNISPGEAVYIGDETKDIDAACKAEIRSVAVAWGLNTKKALLAHNPDYLAEAPEQLLKIFS